MKCISSKALHFISILLAVPKSRLKTYGDRAFSVAAPKLWNELPLDLRILDTINLFKKHLACVAGVRKGRGRELRHEITLEGGGRRGTPARKPLFSPSRLLINK